MSTSIITLSTMGDSNVDSCNVLIHKDLWLLVRIIFFPLMIDVDVCGFMEKPCSEKRVGRKA